MTLTVQQRYTDPEFKDGPFLELRLRAKKLGRFKAGDKVQVITDTKGNLTIQPRGD